MTAVNISASGVYCVVVWGIDVLHRYDSRKCVTDSLRDKFPSLLRPIFDIVVFSIIAIVGISFILVIPFYPFSRAFLVLECFIAIAYFSLEVFEQAEWKSDFPYIS